MNIIQKFKIFLEFRKLKRLYKQTSPIEYIRTSKRLESEVSFTINTFGALDDFELQNGKNKIIGQKFVKGSFFIHIQTEIPEGIYKNIDSHYALQIILGIINQNLPIINNHIENIRNNSKHILLKSISTLDITTLLLNDPSRPKGCYTIGGWPLVVDNFPFQNKLNIYYSELTLDIIHSYFYWDFNKVIVNIIITIEFLSDERKWLGIETINKKNQKKVNNSFIGKLENNFKPLTNFQKIILENLIFIYKIRNMIIHEGKKINYKEKEFIKLCTGSLIHFLKIISKSSKEFQFFSELEAQFLMIDQYISGKKIPPSHLATKDNHKVVTSVEQIEEMNCKIFEFDKGYRNKILKSLK